MRRLADVVSKKNPLLLPITAPITEACRQMAESKADAVVVVDEQNTLRGMCHEYISAHDEPGVLEHFCDQIAGRARWRRRLENDQISLVHDRTQ